MDLYLLLIGSRIDSYLERVLSFVILINNRLWVADRLGRVFTLNKHHAMVSCTAEEAKWTIAQARLYKNFYARLIEKDG